MNRLLIALLTVAIGCTSPTSPVSKQQSNPCQLAIDFIGVSEYNDTTYTIFNQTPTEEDVFWVMGDQAELWYFSWSVIPPVPSNPNVPVYQLGKCYYYHPF